MTVQQLIDELNKFGLNRMVEIGFGPILVPTGVEWDADRRAVTVTTKEAPFLPSPHMYEDEDVCPDCGNIVERGEACFCGE